MTREELVEVSEGMIRQVILRHIPPKTQVYLFGSRARKDHCWNADYDIWIDANLERSELRHIAEELEDSIVPFKVDLVTSEQMTGRFGAQVRKEAVRWM